MKISRSHRKSSSIDRERVILFTVAGVVFAIAADAVDEVRNLDGLVPCAPASAYQRLAKVTYTLERQGQHYLVVDASAHFGTAAAVPTRVMVLRNIPAAVLVDGIERMHDIRGVHPLPAAFQGDERYWYRGLTVLKGRVVPVVNADAFLTRAEFTLLNANRRSVPASMVVATA